MASPQQVPPGGTDNKSNNKTPDDKSSTLAIVPKSSSSVKQTVNSNTVLDDITKSLLSPSNKDVKQQILANVDILFKSPNSKFFDWKHFNNNLRKEEWKTVKPHIIKNGEKWDNMTSIQWEQYANEQCKDFPPVVNGVRQPEWCNSCGNGAQKTCCVCDFIGLCNNCATYTPKWTNYFPGRTLSGGIFCFACAQLAYLT